MPLKTSREQKARTHRFLLSPEALSSCKVSIGGKGLAGMGSSGEGRRKSKQISDPSNIAVVKTDCFSPLENIGVTSSWAGLPSHATTVQWNQWYGLSLLGKYQSRSVHTERHHVHEQSFL